MGTEQLKELKRLQKDNERPRGNFGSEVGQADLIGSDRLG